MVPTGVPVVHVLGLGAGGAGDVEIAGELVGESESLRARQAHDLVRQGGIGVGCDEGGGETEGEQGEQRGGHGRTGSGHAPPSDLRIFGSSDLRIFGSSDLRGRFWGEESLEIRSWSLERRVWGEKGL
jgi:hypothetical protein